MSSCILSNSFGAMGASHFLVRRRRRGQRLGQESRATGVFKAVGGEQGVGARARPVAPCLFESIPDDALAGAFHNAEPDR